MTDMDKQFNELLLINEKVSNLGLFPALGWVWTFDVIKDIFDNYRGDAYDEVIADGVTLRQIWDQFHKDIDSLGLDMDMGGELIEETIREWMIESDFLVDRPGLERWIDD